MRGDFDEARSMFKDAAATYEEFGLRFRRATQSFVGAQIELLAGDPAAAERELRASSEAFDEIGAATSATTHRALLAEVVARLGRLDEAEELAQQVAAEAASHDVIAQVLWRSALARVRAREGSAHEAVELATEARGRLGDSEFPQLAIAALTRRRRSRHRGGRDRRGRAAARRGAQDRRGEGRGREHRPACCRSRSGLDSLFKLRKEAGMSEETHGATSTRTTRASAGTSTASSSTDSKSTDSKSTGSKSADSRSTDSRKRTARRSAPAATTSRTKVGGSARKPLPGARRIGAVPSDEPVEVTVLVRPRAPLPPRRSWAGSRSASAAT